MLYSKLLARKPHHNSVISLVLAVIISGDMTWRQDREIFQVIEPF